MEFLMVLGIFGMLVYGLPVALKFIYNAFIVIVNIAIYGGLAYFLMTLLTK